MITYGLFSMKQGSNQAVPLNQTNNRNLANEFPKKHNHQENIADQLNVRKYLPIILFQLLGCLICYITNYSAGEV